MNTNNLNHDANSNRTETFSATLVDHHAKKNVQNNAITNNAGKIPQACFMIAAIALEVVFFAMNIRMFAKHYSLLVGYVIGIFCSLLLLRVLLKVNNDGCNSDNKRGSDNKADAVYSKNSHASNQIESPSIALNNSSNSNSNTYDNPYTTNQENDLKIQVIHTVKQIMHDIQTPLMTISIIAKSDKSLSDPSRKEALVSTVADIQAIILKLKHEIINHFDTH